MRAIRADTPGGPEVLQLVDIPVPEPGPGQVRIRVAYAALNPLDTHSRAARVKWNAPEFPYTPGYEYAGRVDALGEGVDEAWMAKRVSAVGEWGGNAEYALYTAARLREVPDDINWQLAACFATCAPTAWHLVHSAGRVRPGQTVVIHSAAGAVGALTTQIAKSAGSTVYGLVSSEPRAEYAAQFGADALINYREVNWADEVLRLTEGGGADLIVDGVQGPDAARNYEAVAPLGNVIYLGQMGGPAPEVNITAIVTKSFSVTGFIQYYHQAVTKGTEEPELFGNLVNGTWRIPIEIVAPLEDLADLHAKFESRELFGRTLIEACGEI